jgi:hypothetical protein
MESLYIAHVQTNEQNVGTVKSVLVPFLYYLCKLKTIKSKIYARNKIFQTK